MNMILLEQTDFVSPQRVELRGRRHEHLVEVLGSSAGDELKVGLLDGKSGTGRVVEIGEGRSLLEVNLTQDPLPKHPIVLVLALPRPPVFRRLLSAVTALGVERVCVIHSARVEKGYWNSPSLTEDAVHQAVVLGLEQAGDTLRPEISFHERFWVFAKEELPQLMDGRIALLAHPDEGEPCPSSVSSPVILVVGPEGGFVDDEVAHFKEIGFQAVHLGKRILRVETAVQALIGRLLPL